MEEIVLSHEKLEQLYEMMVKIRRFDEMAGYMAMKENIIKGSIHASIGQEAVPTGVCANLKLDDYITSTHRGHGHCLAKGALPAKMMAELLGKVTGYNRGRGGSMHVADISTGNIGANGIVAGGLSLGVGAAFAIQYKHCDNVVASFFGEGASNQGMFHESLNLASIWKLPIVFVCENNQYAVSTHSSYSLPVKDVAERAIAYGMPGRVVNGNDVLAVYEAAGQAIERARRGEGPTLLECKTYRWEGHYFGEPQVYRTQDEVQEWHEKCPIKLFKQYLMGKGLFSAEELADLDSRVARDIEEAVVFAKGSADPEPGDFEKFVYAE